MSTDMTPEGVRSNPERVKQTMEALHDANVDCRVVLRRLLGHLTVAHRGGEAVVDLRAVTSEGAIADSVALAGQVLTRADRAQNECVRAILGLGGGK